MFWKREYRLTSLDIQNNQIIATINPSTPMFTVRERAIGAALEPILVAAEQRYLNEVMTPARPERSRARVAVARRRLRQGLPLQERLSADEMVITLRGARRSELPLTNVVEVPPPARSHQVVTTARVQGYNLRITVPPSGPTAFTGMQYLYVTSPNRNSGPRYYPPYPGSIEGDARAGRFSPETRGLRDEIETARAPGQLAANRVGASLVRSNLATEHDITSAGRAPWSQVPGQPMAGMTLPGSAMTADADFFGGDGGSDSLRILRQSAVAVIFERLRQAVNNAEPVVQGSEGDALRALGAAFERWLRASGNLNNLTGQGRPRSAAALRNAANALAARLTEFLRATRPTPPTS